MRRGKCGAGVRRLRVEPLESRRVLAALVVDTELDVVDPIDDKTSLREAIAAANSTPGPDVVKFDPLLAGKAIRLTLGELAITDDVTIDGLGQNQLGIDASGNDPTPTNNNGDGSRIFNVDDGDGETHISVVVSGLALFGGDVAERGGAIRSVENLTLQSLLVTQNSAGFDGGGLYLRTDDGAQATIVGTTITNNVVTGTTFNGSGFGGGVYLVAHEGSGITVVDSDISNNRAMRKTQFGGYGAGVYVNSWDGATVRLQDSTVSGNVTGGIERGGGVYARSFDDSRIELEGMTISGNTAGLAAGAYLSAQESSSIVLRRSVVEDNKTTGTFGYGGGVHAYSSGEAALSIEFNTIQDNWGKIGGGIYANSLGSSVMRLDSNFVYRNQSGFLSTTGERGGGIFARPEQNSEMTIVNSTIASNLVLNTASGGGAGLSTQVLGSGKLSILSSTIILNSSSGTAAGLWVPDGGSPRVKHTIVANNSAGPSHPDDVVGAVRADWNLIGDSAGAVITGGNNLLDTQPMLTSLNDNGGPTSSFAPQAMSPVVNAGDPAAAVGDGETPAYDQRGLPYERIAVERIDIGAVERHPPIAWADFDDDFDVDGSDFLAWQRGFGTALPFADHEDGDADDDLDVDATDLGVWAGQWGTTMPAAGANAAAHAPAADAALQLLATEPMRSRDGGAKVQGRKEADGFSQEFIKLRKDWRTSEAPPVPTLQRPDGHHGMVTAEGAAAALGSPVGGGAWSSLAGGPNSSVSSGFSPSAHAW